MNNSKNAIGKISELYSELLDAYEEKNKIKKFEKCYELADKATYKEIHMAISYIKEDNESGDISGIPNESVQKIMSALLTLVVGNVRGRKAYLLDILEEARERKRP